MGDKYFGENKRELDIDLVELLSILYKHALLIILMKALGLSMAFAYTRFFVKLTYRGESMIIFSRKSKRAT